uniref:Secreted protein n=1 Tax=Caenorhabditis tropicalis TaxID=1561998 RepID=A0A1I7THV1_9PELO
MFKICVLSLLAFASIVNANIDATSFGAPADNHKTKFGAAIPASSGLADEGDSQLQHVDTVPQDEGQQSANHVREMFSNVFNSIKTQREQAIAANATNPTD